MKEHASWDNSLVLWPEHEVQRGKRMLEDWALRKGLGICQFVMTFCHLKEFCMYSLDSGD